MTTQTLNPQQQEAIAHMGGPLLVLAGAGAGKTAVVTERIGRLLDLGVPASDILALTFTNKAAGEMAGRVHRRSHQQVLISTFHSLGCRILRRSIGALGYTTDFVIYDEEDAHKLIKQCFDELGIRSKEFKPKPFKGLISETKNQMVEPGEVENEKRFPEIYTLYQSKLKEYNAVDFDDLLGLTVRLFKEHPEVLEEYQNQWQFLLIDEYQDTNEPQYLIARMLVAKTQNIFVVGDPDQSIYSWRGANIGNILNFERDYPGAKIVRLEQNYRSTNTILTASNALIANNTGRYEKNLFSTLGEGEAIRLVGCQSDREEADFVVDRLDTFHRKGLPLNEIVIFYRTNFQSRQFEDALLKRRIPYVIVGGLSFYQRKEIKDLLCYLRMVESGADFLALARTLNMPKRGIGPSGLEKLRQGAITQQMPVYNYCQALVRADLPSPLSKKAQEGLGEYVRAINTLRLSKETLSLPELVAEAMHSTGYLAHLREDPETFQDRKENLEELISKASERDMPLGEFLEELSLKSTLDEATMEDERLRLMTIHNGKGLEFECVFMAGMEETLFPHANSLGDMDAIEEERRLCYVGMTRAKKHLFMTYSGYRFLWGSPHVMRPSRFLNELPKAQISRLSEDEDDFDLPTEGFSPGDKIYHKDFGPGLVQETSNGSLGLTYRVLFQRDRSVKTLVAQYAKLTKV